jgi:hypothetical protein
VIPVSASLTSLLRSGRGGFRRQYVADVIYDGQRVLQDVPLGQCELRQDGNAKIRTQGTATVRYNNSWGDSIVPDSVGDWFTPYATTLNVSMRISAGNFSEKVLRGVLKVTDVTDPIERRQVFQKRRIVVGSQVSLTLADAFAVTDRERFPVPFGPSDLTSVWQEIGRLTLLPLAINVTDTPITRAVTYEENRLDAVFALADILDAVPYINPSGQLTMQPNTWPATSEGLDMGSTGTITSAGPGALHYGDVYNQVVVRSSDNGQNAILDDSAKVTTGPLRWGGPFGRVPYFASSQYVTTQAQAAAYGLSLLPKVSAAPAMTWLITCIPTRGARLGT